MHLESSREKKLFEKSLRFEVRGSRFSDNVRRASTGNLSFDYLNFTHLFGMGFCDLTEPIVGCMNDLEGGRCC